MATAKDILAVAFEATLAAKAGLTPAGLQERHPNYKQFPLQRFYPFDLAKAQWACRVTTETELAKAGLRLLPQDISALVNGIRLDLTVDAGTTVMANFAVRAIPANFGSTDLPGTEFQNDLAASSGPPTIKDLVLIAIQMDDSNIDDVRFDRMIIDETIERFAHLEANGPNTLSYKLFVAENILQALRPQY